MRALLFDLDGTLTRSAGAGARALGKALGARTRATEELRKMRLDGMTDRAIARILLAAERGEEPAQVTKEEIDQVLEQYLHNLEGECAASAYEAIPGVAAVLDRLASRDDVLLGLCTGNIERGAKLKLGCTGLWERFRFGGYGSDAEPRPEIVRTAWKRAEALGAKEALVIGDTPRDILAAHEAGLPACGVATGRWSTHDLAVHGAEVVLEDWSDPDRASSLLVGVLRWSAAMRLIAFALLVAAAACKRPPPAPKFCDQDLSGVWVNASDTHFAYRLSDKGDTVNGQFFSREADGGEAPSEGEPIRIELKRASDTLAGVMKGSGQSLSGRACPVDFKLNVTSCEAASLQIVAETRVSVRDDCSRARSEDGGLAKTTLVEYRWQRP